MSIEGAPQAPLTATGTPPRNVDGQAIAITVFSTVKWWGGVWLPVLFLGARLFPRSLDTLKRLSFIHFARWTLIREIPYNGPPQQQERWRTRTCSSKAISTAGGRSTSTPSRTS